MTPNRTSSRRIERAGAPAGFTLLEVLIALLVLSLGLLGLAGLQGATVQFNHGAYLRSQATSLAYDMADRIRANRDGNYDIAFADPAPACAPPAGGATVAARDIAAWRSALACTLPLGNGFIEINAADRLLTIGVRWDESRGEASEEELERFDVTTRL